MEVDQRSVVFHRLLCRSPFSPLLHKKIFVYNIGIQYLKSKIKMLFLQHFW
jgi:hypothetical protein